MTLRVRERTEHNIGTRDRIRAMKAPPAELFRLGERLFDVRHAGRC